MSSVPNWKKAQDKVASVFNVEQAAGKTLVFRRFVDTFEAQGNIVAKQLSDFWMLYGGMFSLVEVKSSEYADKFYFKDVQPGQWVGTARIPHAGGKCIFLIVKLPEWQWYYVSGEVMLQMKRDGEAGIRWAQMTPIKLKVEEVLCQMGLLQP